MAPASPPSSNITPPGVGSATKSGLGLPPDSPFGQAGMLSAALLGNSHPGSILSGFPSTPPTSSGGNISQHPPTPPRTPKTPLGEPQAHPRGLDYLPIISKCLEVTRSQYLHHYIPPREMESGLECHPS